MTAALPTPEALRAHIDALERGLLEREAAVRVVLLAALAGEHVLLIGPPGTAKSELARRLQHAFAGARYFERLLTRFSTPEELFGPLSLKALEDDRYERLIDGYLPTAGIAFLDEVFKANSAILNALLTLLNEREFDNGTERLHTPLVCVIGASNELPTDEALLAFFDRFLLRMVVQPVGDASFAALVDPAGSATAPAEAAPDAPQAALLQDAPQAAGAAAGVAPSAEAGAGAPAPITPAERAALQQTAAAVHLSAPALEALRSLRAWCAGRGLPVSDRRWRQFAALMRVVAAGEGRAEVDALDLWLAPQVVSAEAPAAQAASDWFVEQVAQAAPQDAPWLTRAVEAFERQLELEAAATADDAAEQAAEHDAGKLALARSLSAQGPGAAQAADESGAGSPLRLRSSRLEAQQRRRYAPLHIAARVAQVDELLGRSDALCGQAAQQLDALRAALAPRLFMPPPLHARLLDGPARTLAKLRALQARLLALRTGFDALPVDPRMQAAQPPASPLRAQA